MSILYSTNQIREKLQIAMNSLFQNDSFLLERHAHQNAVSHKLALYLDPLFPHWNVDCQYNLKGIRPKVLEGIKNCSERKRNNKIIPDILIHLRNRNDEDSNLLVIEVKTNNYEINCAKKKLELLTVEGGKFDYHLGVFIKFNELDCPTIIWYKNGIVLP